MADFNFNDITQYITGFITLWVGYIHKSLNERPTRGEIDLRQQKNDIIQQNIKEDIQEIKTDIKEILDRLNDSARS